MYPYVFVCIRMYPYVFVCNFSVCKRMYPYVSVYNFKHRERKQFFIPEAKIARGVRRGSSGGSKLSDYHGSPY